MTSLKLKPDAIDSHVHLWTDDFSRYPLAQGFKSSDMALRRFMPEDVLAKAQANGVSRILLIQMSYYGFDNSLMLDAIRHHPNRFRGIAVVDENQSNVAATMRQLAKSGVRGFRIMAVDPSVKLLDRKGLRAMFTHAAREHLVLGFLTGPDNLPELDRICARFPNTPVVIDHMARIGMNGLILPSAVKTLCSLARHPRTAVKISAFYALGRKRPPHDELAPLVRSLYDSFGPSRLMWGSDSPFQLISETYRDSIDFIRDRLPFLTEEDKTWILRGTAENLFFS